MSGAVSENQKRRKGRKRFLVSFVYFLSALCLTAPLQGDEKKIILLGEFRSAQGPENPALARQIREKVKLPLIRNGFVVRFLPATSPARALRAAKDQGAWFYIGGYYRRNARGNLEIYGQIYRPDPGYVIDALSASADAGVPEELELPPEEMRVDDGETIRNLRPATGRAGCSPIRREKNVVIILTNIF